MIKKKHKWCCQSAENRFHDRNTYGEFLVAGISPHSREVQFFAGSNLAHRKNYDAVLDGIQKASKALDEIGISNFKLSWFGCVHYCSSCGKNLSKHYGSDGGLLRDDEYVEELYKSA